MQATIQQLEHITIQYKRLLKNISEEEYNYIPSPGKWSKKEILGHLIDSAQNNIRRFIMAQYQDKPQVVYEQDSWVRLANYRHYETASLIELWALLNKHACIILTNIPSGVEKRECITGEPHSIEWIANDYLQHLLHHLHQILNLEPVLYS